MDYFYKAHNGTMPGSRLRLPYPAPSDQIIDMREMEERMPGRWREGSFLLKDRAAAINASVLLLRVCSEEGSSRDCAAGDARAEPRDDEVRMLPGRSLAELRTALSGVFEQYKVRQGDEVVVSYVRPTMLGPETQGGSCRPLHSTSFRLHLLVNTTAEAARDRRHPAPAGADAGGAGGLQQEAEPPHVQSLLRGGQPRAHRVGGVKPGQ